jgi:MFS family permease
MLAFFWFLFVTLIVTDVALHLYLRRKTPKSISTSTEFQLFQRNYLTIFWLVMFADWLQGPYVYALYESYGFSQGDIANLFIVGFGSSMIFGTIVGSLADKYGRKFMAMAFGFIYSAGCLTKLFPVFEILLIGRLLSGIATSLLFSVFEAWMVHEHHRHNFPSDWLSYTFTIATFGNGIVAIIAGLISSLVVLRFGYVSPFMLSMIGLLFSSCLVWKTWTENYGDSKVEVKETFVNALVAMKKDMRITVVGMIQALFEGSMYTFVFMWTPTLVSVAEEFREENSPMHGLVFAAYMVAIMIGSSAFGLLKAKFPVESIGKVNLIVAMCSLSVPIFCKNAEMVFFSFVMFETCVGLYFPTQGTLRSKYIPEETRAAIMNFYRVPLNLFVVLTLKYVCHRLYSRFNFFRSHLFYVNTSLPNTNLFFPFFHYLFILD